MIASFIAAFAAVSGLVYLNYPDKAAFPREFEGGLERELGGPSAVRVRLPRHILSDMLLIQIQARMEGDEEP